MQSKLGLILSSGNEKSFIKYPQNIRHVRSTPLLKTESLFSVFFQKGLKMTYCSSSENFRFLSALIWTANANYRTN